LPTTGSADIATTAIPTYSTSTEIVAEAISRCSPRRPTCSSPDSPDADSRPVNTTVATPNANSASPQVGVSPRSIESVISPASKNTSKPSTTTITCSTTSTITSAEIRCTRVRANPRIERHATHARIASATTFSSVPRPSGDQNAAR
jgi:hypothetical protein